MNEKKGIISWFIDNPVAANLLMAIVCLCGLLAASDIRKSFFPSIEHPTITVSVVYPGASPSQIESAITERIEYAVRHIRELETVRSQSSNDFALVTLEVDSNAEIESVRSDVEAAVNGISAWPNQAEKPQISLKSPHQLAVVLQLTQKAGSAISDQQLQFLAHSIEHELKQKTSITHIELSGIQDSEIAINVSQSSLIEHQLSLDQIAAAIRQSSINVAAGNILSSNGSIRLQSQGQAYWQRQFEEIVVKKMDDGGLLKLGHIADITDGFVENSGYQLFDYRRSIGLAIYANGEQDISAISQAAATFAKQMQLPDSVELTSWQDSAYYLNDREGMMIGNLLQGIVLVFIALSFFLDIRLALWVVLGLPFCFLGTLALMSMNSVDISVNMVTLFAFILVLGVLVDDAIIVGESIYKQCQYDGHTPDNVLAGTLNVSVPATFGVLTTVAAFAPLLFSEGPMASWPISIGFVVCSCLLLSLIESKLILPSHLANVHLQITRKKPNGLMIWRERQLARFEQFSAKQLPDWISRALSQHINSLAIFIALLIISIALLSQGHVRYNTFPTLASDYISLEVELVESAAKGDIEDTINIISNSLSLLNEKQNNEPFLSHMGVTINSIRHADFKVELTRSDRRDLDSQDIISLWKQAIPLSSGIKSLRFSNASQALGSDVQFKITSNDSHQLDRASKHFAQFLRPLKGVRDVDDRGSEKSKNLHFSPRLEGEALGISQSSLGSTLRSSVHGIEVQRLQRDFIELKVVLRLPEPERNSSGLFNQIQVATPTGQSAPLSSVADIEWHDEYSTILKLDGEQAMEMGITLDKQQMTSGQLWHAVQTQFLPKLREKYPDVELSLTGVSAKEAENLQGIAKQFLLSLIGIYALLAIPLRSYKKPLIIMSAIPFGIIGAIVGHWLTGTTMTLMSLFGVVALSGVVVNDSLLMVTFINRAMQKGANIDEAMRNAVSKRFRPIFLTSITTFAGLLPMLLESSLQAETLIPMAISLGFGILFATAISLVLIPCLYKLMRNQAESPYQITYSNGQFEIHESRTPISKHDNLEEAEQMKNMLEGRDS